MRSSTLKVISRLMVLLPLLTGLAGCSDPAPYKVGFIAGLSDRVADLGIAGRNGAMLAIERQNQAGGINGRQLQLLVRDDRQDPEAAIAGVKALLEEEVELIIGPMTSAMSVATLPLMNQRQVVLLSPTATANQLTAKDDYFIRVIQDTDIYARRNADYRYRAQGARRVAVAYDTRNAAYSEGWLGSFKTAFEALGGKVVLQLPFYSSDQLHFTQLAQQLVAAEPDAIQIISGAVDAALLIQQIRKLDPRLPLATSEWAATEKLIELGGTAVNGVVMAQFFDRQSQHPYYLDFKSAFVKRFGHEPGFAELAAYDAAQVALQALAQRQGNETLKQAILRIGRFRGGQGEVHIDRFGDAQRENHITRIERGQFLLTE